MYQVNHYKQAAKEQREREAAEVEDRKRAVAAARELLAEDLGIKPPNRIKSIKRLGNGSLEVEQHSGNVFTLGPDDEQFQAFVVYLVLAGE